MKGKRDLSKEDYMSKSPRLIGDFNRIDDGLRAEPLDEMQYRDTDAVTRVFRYP